MFKKILFFVILCIVVLFLAMETINTNAASGNREGFQVVITTGTTGINFDRITKEIWVVTLTTGIAYTNFISSTAVGVTNNRLQMVAVTAEPYEIREEIESSRMSVIQTTGPVNIRIKWKYYDFR